MSDTHRLLGRKGILASLSGVHRELSWLLSVVRDTESDMRDGDEQLLLFWLLLATVSSSKESASSANTGALAGERGGLRAVRLLRCRRSSHLSYPCSASPLWAG